jgi:hypothetical protein
MFEQPLRRLRLRQKNRRGPPAALPGADMWQRALGEGTHCPYATCHAPFNDKVFAGSLF